MPPHLRPPAPLAHRARTGRLQTLPLLAALLSLAPGFALAQAVRTSPGTLQLTDSSRVGEVRVINPSQNALDLRVDAVATATGATAHDSGCDAVELFRFAPTRFRLAAGDTILLRVAATPRPALAGRTCEAQLIMVARRASQTRLVLPDSNGQLNDLGTTALARVGLTYRATERRPD
jgi:hypothetical protein